MHYVRQKDDKSGFSENARVYLMTNIKYKFNLLGSIVTRELSKKYKGTLFGFGWNVINPIFMLIIYSTVFLTVFKARWVIENDETVNYALMLFVGIITHAFLSEVMANAASVIESNKHIVKKVVFPLELFPISVVLIGALNFLIGIMLSVAYAIWADYILNYWSLLYIPIIVIVYMITLCAVAYVFSAISVFVKDIAQIIPVISLVMLFTSTVFFSVRSAPEELSNFLYINPISVVADTIREVLYKGTPDLTGLMWLFAISTVILFLAYGFYSRVKASFSDIV